VESQGTFRDRFSDTRVLWQTRMAAYCLGIDEFVPLAMVLSLDDGCDLDLMERRTGIRFYSREKTEGRRRALGDDPETYTLLPAIEHQLMSSLRDSPTGRWKAVSPYPSVSLRGFAAKTGIGCHCRTWEESRLFGSKRGLRACLDDLDLPRLPARMLDLGQVRYPELASEFGGRFVMQQDMGAAGRGTAIIGSPEDLAEAGRRFGVSEVWVAPYAGCLSFNVNAVAVDHGTVVGFPSVQIVGQPFLHGTPSGHAGNDFTAAAAAPSDVLTSIRKQSERIGSWMTARGYRGLFGLDFVVDEASGTPLAVDLNPRWQASTSLQAQAESRQGRIPLAAVELAAQLGMMNTQEILAMAEVFFQPLEGSQVFPKNAHGRWCQARNKLEAGVYSAALEYARPALRLRELNAPDELVITGGVPRPGRPMAAGTWLLRICGVRAAVDGATGQPLPWVEEAVRKVYNQVDLEEVD